MQEVKRRYAEAFLEVFGITLGPMLRSTPESARADLGMR
jgi:hypothetical protein